MSPIVSPPVNPFGIYLATISGETNSSIRPDKRAPKSTNGKASRSMARTVIMKLSNIKRC